MVRKNRDKLEGSEKAIQLTKMFRSNKTCVFYEQGMTEGVNQIWKERNKFFRWQVNIYVNK